MSSPSRVISPGGPLAAQPRRNEGGIEEGLAGAPDPLRIWLAVGDPEAVRV